MNDQTSQNTGSKIIYWIKNSISARMFMVGALILILLIPLLFVQELIRERAIRQENVVSEINDKWGDEVLVYGPVLKIPYRTFREKSITNSQTKEVTTESIEEVRYAYFLPKELNIKALVNPEMKKRGIYKTAVYKSRTELTGSFSVPNFDEEDIAEEHIIWEKSRIIFQISNLKGVNEQVNISLGHVQYNFTSKYQEQTSLPGAERQLFSMESESLKEKSLPQKNPVSFSMQLSVNGSSQISFVPVGKITEAQISSNWKTNNFTGNFLPYNEDKITAEGFNAKWKILDINRPFPQSFISTLPNLSEYAFGVNFMIPVDEYQKSERAAKYGFLVIGLTFLLFFLIQTLSNIPIHPFQYVMIGLGLVMFYTLLISISEHSSFLKAYLIAGTAIILLITLYSKSILKGWKFPLFIGLALSALYSFIYIIIQLESYALLVGSIGLFMILAGVMYASRKIDWENY
ncbi:cell envelope integrity protein CreD [Salegentibacter sp. F188]|uniref:Cell envelope integrity protein CreD n=1 Tax=Autumnicola patrickiae TaxID=3075591 RepID=A0ABU3DYI7_9FLAO|nr:cell envelope integrity protein CreD [Salegentibacter sp. F188]MDT0688723.1 cell envelope integrity protein CreD [Salegentibacter sp. F188]